MEKPKIRKLEGACIDEVAVNVVESSDYMACVGMLRREICRYSETDRTGKIILKDSKTQEEIPFVSLGNIMAMRTLNGKSLDISVTGNYSESERMANLLYAAFACGGPRKADIRPYCIVPERKDEE